MPLPTPTSRRREITLLAVPSPREEATRPAPVDDREGPAATLPLPSRPSPPAALRRRHPFPSTHPAAPRAVRRFRLLARIGSGGMGTVYLALDPLLGRAIALKRVDRDDPGLGRRLVAEARLLARVDHPNVCRVYEAGEEGGRPYIAMQLVAGETLRQAAPEMSLRERLEVVLAVVEGLAEVHRLGLVHRDVKPQNVMVERTPQGGWRPCLVDFGIARPAAAAAETAPGYLLATPAYAAPEQVRSGAAVDHRADLYSVGALLYELVCGRPPFGEGSQAIPRLLAEEPVAPRRLAPDLGPDLETLVLTCLAKEPARRYPSAPALAADLRRILAGEPLAARRPGVTARLCRRARKHPRAAAAAGLAAALVLALTSLAWNATAEAAEQTRRVGRLERRVQSLATPTGAGGASGAGRRSKRDYTMLDIFYPSGLPCSQERAMALNLKSPEVERLVEEVVARTAESKTEAVRRALRERLDRLALEVVRGNRKEDVMRYLEREVWPKVPAEILGRGVSQQEQDEILGYGPDGT
jgi:eukaryotic-like serine/threonine-protein kinase